MKLEKQYQTNKYLKQIKLSKQMVQGVLITDDATYGGMQVMQTLSGNIFGLNHES